MSGWNDPIWSALYPPAAQQPAQQQQPVADAPVHYLDVLAGAAITNQAVNLSSMAGFQTNLQSPGEQR